MPFQSFVQESQPTACSVGDLWLQPSLRKLAVCVTVDPTVTFMEVVRGGTPTVTITNLPAGGTGAAAGGYDTAVNRDAAIASVNALLAALRLKGIIA